MKKLSLSIYLCDNRVDSAAGSQIRLSLPIEIVTLIQKIYKLTTKIFDDRRGSCANCDPRDTFLCHMPLLQDHSGNFNRLLKGPPTTQQSVYIQCYVYFRKVHCFVPPRNQLKLYQLKRHRILQVISFIRKITIYRSLRLVCSFRDFPFIRLGLCNQTSADSSKPFECRGFLVLAREVNCDSFP